jgi:hypothetical protein
MDGQSEWLEEGVLGSGKQRDRNSYQLSLTQEFHPMMLELGSIRFGFHFQSCCFSNCCAACLADHQTQALEKATVYDSYLRGDYMFEIFFSGHQIIRKHYQKPWMQMAIKNVFLQQE